MNFCCFRLTALAREGQCTDTVVKSPMFRRISSLAFVCPLFAVLVTSAPVRAERSTLAPETGYHYGEVEDGRWAALAGALRARGTGMTGVFANPAGIASTRVYHAGALAQIWPEAKRQSYGAAIVDSVTSSLAAGLGFVWSDQDPDGLKRRSSDIRIALAYPFSDKVSFGLAGRYLKLSQNGLGPLGSSLASGGLPEDPIVNGVSFDAGLVIQPTRYVSVGALGTNLTNPSNGFQPTTAGGGIAVGNDDFSLEVDAVANFTTWQKTRARVMGGFELLLGDHFPLRVGYAYDDGSKAHAVSGGVGYVDTQFSLDLSARRFVAGESATALILCMQYFIESTGMTRTAQPDF